MKKHPKHCECLPCVRRKLLEYEDKVRLLKQVRMPVSPDQMVPVRAHFRRHPGYLNKSPVLKDLVQSIVNGLIKGALSNGNVQPARRTGRSTADQPPGVRQARRLTGS